MAAYQSLLMGLEGAPLLGNVSGRFLQSHAYRFAREASLHKEAFLARLPRLTRSRLLESQLWRRLPE